MAGREGVEEMEGDAAVSVGEGEAVRVAAAAAGGEQAAAAVSWVAGEWPAPEEAAAAKGEEAAKGEAARVPWVPAAGVTWVPAAGVACIPAEAWVELRWRAAEGVGAVT